MIKARRKNSGIGICSEIWKSSGDIFSRV
jgi:hypothetical protein